MILARAPYRLSFFGGGTDYPSWAREHGGAVLSTTIDKYCHVTIRHLPPFFAHRHRVVWSHVEAVNEIGEILHPAVREAMRMLDFEDGHGLEIHHQGDLPARAGMGSSSSFAVSLLQGLSAYRGSMIAKYDLARMAIELEQDRLGENVGSQDQVAAAFGGFNKIEFRRNGDIRVVPLTLPAGRLEELEERILLFFTGSSRLASDVAADVVANLPRKEKSLRRMYEMVDEAVSLLASDRDLDEFGAAMDEAWELKRGLADRIASDTVADVYRRARKAGALGGKLLGAGGSGFMAFFVPPRRQDAVIRALNGFLHVPFRFETEGASIVHFGSRAPVAETRTTLNARRPARQRTRARTASHARASGAR